MAHGILRDQRVFSDSMVVPDLALHEVINSVWKHEHIIKDLKDGLSFVSVLIDLVDAGVITLVTPSRKLAERAYRMAAKHKTSFYDCVFVALALEVGLGLRTLDAGQAKIFRAEKAR